MDGVVGRGVQGVAFSAMVTIAFFLKTCGVPGHAVCGIVVGAFGFCASGSAFFMQHPSVKVICWARKIRMSHHRRRHEFLLFFVLFCQNYLRFLIPLLLPEFAALSMVVGLSAWLLVW